MSLPSFGVRHPVPTNLLALVIFIGGLVAALTMTREFFPDTTPLSCRITLVYPGATPEEIEESLARKVEDKLAELDEVEQMTTTLAEGGGGIFVEFRDGIDVTEATDEVERAIETLRDLPEEAERIRVEEFKPILPTIMLSIFGDASEESLKRAITAIRDELRTLPDMGDIQLSGTREYELTVEVDPDRLVELGLSLPDVAGAVSNWMKDVPGGVVRAAEGNWTVRVMGVEEQARALREVVVKSRPDGASVRLDEIAQISDGYVDDQVALRFSDTTRGGRSTSLTVYKQEDQDAVAIAEMVRAYAAGRRVAAGLATEEEAYEVQWKDRAMALVSGGRSKSARRQAFELGAGSSLSLPPGTDLAISSDLARFIEGRLSLLLRNAFSGSILVFLTLLVFMNWRTSIWVGAGLVTALAGTALFMALLGITLNLLTMFGLIIVVGMLVDDAIVIAENIEAWRARGVSAVESAIRGAGQVAWPVVGTVTTTIVAFFPLTFIKGTIGDLIGALPGVVACALLVSLLECVLILPAHMAHSLVRREREAARRKGPSWVGRIETARDRFLFGKVVPAYAWLVRLGVRYRYINLSLALSAVIVSFGMIAGGRLQFEFIPSSDSETVIAELRMPIGTPLVETEAAVRRIEEAARAQGETLTVQSLLGVTASVDDTSGVQGAGLGTHLGQLFIELVPVEARDRDSGEISGAIRDAVGTIDGAESFSFTEIQGGPAGKDITIQISSPEPEVTRQAVQEVRALLLSLADVRDVSDDDAQGQREVRVTLQPGSSALGFSAQSVAAQVRGALFGIDAHVFSARREDIDVRVKLAERARNDLNLVENLWVGGALEPGAGDRDSVPLSEIADIEETRAYSTIRRIDRERVTSVTADAAPGVPVETITTVLAPGLDEIRARHGGAVHIDYGGRQRQLAKAFASLPLGFGAAIVMIYAILAWVFGSYFQPFAVMLAIPFGIIGVIWGHIALGYTLTFLSLVGFVALSGVAVNDSLIFVEFFNEQRRAGASLDDALVEAGRRRLRPIFLTTLTTVLGLTPLILEESFQARFLIPMAIAISFGLTSATVLVLFLLPAVLKIFDDVRRVAQWLWGSRA